MTEAERRATRYWAAAHLLTHRRREERVRGILALVRMEDPVLARRVDGLLMPRRGPPAPVLRLTRAG